jgi:hypothetical protein
MYYADKKKEVGLVRLLVLRHCDDNSAAILESETGQC